MEILESVKLRKSQYFFEIRLGLFILIEKRQKSLGVKEGGYLLF